MTDDRSDDLPADLERDFALVVRRFQHPLSAYLFQFVGDRETARDLTQEVFVKAYRHLAGYDRSRPFATWLFAIAGNHARDHLRRRRLPMEPVADHHPEPATVAPGPDVSLVHAELGAALQAALAQLPLEERELVVLRHVAGLSLEEIGRALGLPPATAKTRLFRARQRLQSLLTHVHA